MTTYYRIDVQPPGSEGWLRFKVYADEASAREAAADLRKNATLYRTIKVSKVTEEVID